MISCHSLDSLSFSNRSNSNNCSVSQPFPQQHVYKQSMDLLFEALQKERIHLFCLLGQEEQLYRFKPSLVVDQLIIEEAVRVFCSLSAHNPQLLDQLCLKVKNSFKRIGGIKDLLESASGSIRPNSHPIQAYFESDGIEEMEDMIPDELCSN